MQGKTIVVTGASSGIGEAIVLNALSEGHQVIGISRRGNKEITHDAYIDIRVDLLKLVDGNDRLPPALFAKLNKIDVLINNAGMLSKGDWKTCKADDVIQMFKINVLAPIELSKQLLPLLRHSDGSHIINVSSMSGVVGSEKFQELFGYGLTKSALHTATEYMAQGLQADSVVVNTIAPGAVKTKMLKEAFPDYNDGADADSVAHFILGFALSGNKILTGKIVPLSVTSP